MDGKKNPTVMCLTNTVAANWTANVLLAIGARPAMIEDPDEAAELANHVDAVLVNVGTITRAQAEVQRVAVQRCTEQNIPWVLDPVAIHLLSFRRNLVFEFIKSNPSIIRGNSSEIRLILGTVPKIKGTVPRKIKGTVPQELGQIVYLETGKTDRIWRGGEVVREVSGGVELLQRVTATGCAQGAICAAFLGWGQSPETAAFNASRLMKAAGELAFSHAATCGSFQIALLDALDELAGDYHD